VVLLERKKNPKTHGGVYGLQLLYDPEGFVEKAGDTLGVVSSRVEGDLERFKEFIEKSCQETGAWRGTIRE
jgi:hypothetical protein